MTAAKPETKRKVRVTAIFDLLVSEQTLNRWRNDPTELKRYALTGCFRCNSRTLIDVRTDPTQEDSGLDPGPRHEPVVPASGHSDDWLYEVTFDAADWLARASDSEIRALHDCDYGHDTAADEVLVAAAKTNREIADLLDYCRRTQQRSLHIGFECVVNREAALAWIEENRPQLHAELTSEAST